MSEFQTGANAVDSEYTAMIAQGMTDEQWYAQSREQRAARVAHHIGHIAVSAMREHDRAEKRKAEGTHS